MGTDEQSMLNSGQLAQFLARRDSGGSTPAPAEAAAFDGVLFAYVDNSNVWIEGRGFPGGGLQPQRGEQTNSWSLIGTSIG